MVDIDQKRLNLIPIEVPMYQKEVKMIHNHMNFVGRSCKQ
jgi:hypothetical protein